MKLCMSSAGMGLGTWEGCYCLTNSLYKVGAMIKVVLFSNSSISAKRQTYKQGNITEIIR